MTWALPEDVAPGAKVGLVIAWFPYPQVEANELYHWHDGDPPPDPPQDYLLGEWRPSPNYQSAYLMRNYKIVPAVAGLFPEGDYIHFYARGTDWFIPKGTPHIVLVYDNDRLHSPHEPPAHLR